MSTVKEIKAAIAALPMEERAQLESWLHHQADPNPGRVVLPDQAVRRRNIYGQTVLPNTVLLERESNSL
jgi:hypothetical protein